MISIIFISYVFIKSPYPTPDKAILLVKIYLIFMEVKFTSKFKSNSKLEDQPFKDLDGCIAYLFGDILKVLNTLEEKTCHDVIIQLMQKLSDLACLSKTRNESETSTYNYIGVKREVKNIQAKYPKLEESQIQTIVRKNLTFDILELDNFTQINYHFLKKKNLNSKRFVIDGVEPVSICPMKENYSSSNWIPIKKPTLKISGINNFKNDFMKFDDFIQSIVSLSPGLEIDIACNWIADQLESLNIVSYSESILVNILMQRIIYLSNQERLTIISVDKKERDFISCLGRYIEYRCDILFIIGNTLVIIETKFRSDRHDSQALDGLNCILYKAYAKRTLRKYSYLPQIIECEWIAQLGIGYSVVKARTNVGMELEIRRKSDFDNIDISSEAFWKAMKNNAHRFKNIFN